jgi:hypothetical protein
MREIQNNAIVPNVPKTAASGSFADECAFKHKMAVNTEFTQNMSVSEDWSNHCSCIATFSFAGQKGWRFCFTEQEL